MELNSITSKVDSNLRLGVVHTTLFDRDCTEQLHQNLSTLTNIQEK
jgi:hypothetical protein